TDRIEELETRLRRVEDELAIRDVILSYGPAADTGRAEVAASAWSEDGTYDWDASAPPFGGRDDIAAMLRSDAHQHLLDTGVAHVAGPPLVELDGDHATALGYTMVMRRDPETRRFSLWRVSAARWELERRDGSWQVRRRTHRLLDGRLAAQEVFAERVTETAPEAHR
ncbi:MAG: nuclear transport factor 2 family protein, partial [Acidimicrobiales bacterium]